MSKVAAPEGHRQVCSNAGQARSAEYAAASTRQIVEAAQRRGISFSDDVRTAADSQARRELDFAQACVIIQTPAEQLEFWNALNARVRLTIARSRPEQLLDPTPRR